MEKEFCPFLNTFFLESVSQVKQRTKVEMCKVNLFVSLRVELNSTQHWGKVNLSVSKHQQRKAAQQSLALRHSSVPFPSRSLCLSIFHSFPRVPSIKSRTSVLQGPAPSLPTESPRVYGLEFSQMLMETLLLATVAGGSPMGELWPMSSLAKKQTCLQS